MVVPRNLSLNGVGVNNKNYCLRKIWVFTHQQFYCQPGQDLRGQLQILRVLPSQGVFRFGGSD